MEPFSWDGEGSKLNIIDGQFPKINFARGKRVLANNQIGDNCVKNLKFANVPDDETALLHAKWRYQYNESSLELNNTNYRIKKILGVPAKDRNKDYGYIIFKQLIGTFSVCTLMKVILFV